jgi:hypothetical protein
LDPCREALKANGFTVYGVPIADAAGSLILDELVQAIAPKIVSWGDSMTLAATGVIEALLGDSKIEVIRTFDGTVPREVLIERRRRALLCDLFFTGSNAVTLAGELVNLDMIGNRVAGLVFGPRQVIVTLGRNKVVPDLEAAMTRIRNHAAPANAARHGFKTPCVKEGRCMDCRSPPAHLQCMDDNGQIVSQRPDHSDFDRRGFRAIGGPLETMCIYN